MSDLNRGSGKTPPGARVMISYFVCPACGRKHQVSNPRGKRKLVCSACNEVIRQSPTGNGSGPPFLTMAVRKPLAVLEASIPGTMSGVFAGVPGAILAGALAGQSMGNIIATAMLGMVIGFAGGTLMAAVLVAGVRRIRPGFGIESRIAALAAGALIGSIVILILEDARWVAVGAVAGALGSILWTEFCKRIHCDWVQPSRDSDNYRFMDKAVGSAAP